MSLSGRILRGTRAVVDPALRIAWLLDLFAHEPEHDLALALDAIAERAEQGDTEAREALVGIVDAMSTTKATELAQRLREEAAGRSMPALDRLLRVPSPPRASMPPQEKIAAGRDGRPLTLGERKALARKPDPALLAKLSSDPNPEVVRRLLENPRLTENDVIRMIARRPALPEILAEIARSVRWIHRPRVRLALLLNPGAPADLVAPITSLLARQELEEVIAAPPVHPAVRALCIERLRRKPPFSHDQPDPSHPELH